MKNDSRMHNKKYSLIKERVETYKDFTLNLLSCIYDYYLDKLTLSLDEDIRNHYMFCYNKICDGFLTEGIDFKKNKKLIEYFYNYYYHHFYKIEKEIPQTYFKEFWSTIFKVDNPKNKNTQNVMVELYAIFDLSITTKNILELV